MPIVVVILILVAAGVILSLVNKYGSAYIDDKFIKLINIVAIVAAIVWLMKIFGIWQYIWTIHT